MRRTLIAGLILALPLVLAGCGQRRSAEAGESGRLVPEAAAPSTVADDGIVRTAGCVYATTTPEMFIGGTPQPANQERLGEVADRIVPRGTSKEFEPVFGGVVMVQERDRLQVYRKPSAALDAWILKDFKAECVELIDIKFAMVELTALQTRITDDVTYWRQRGIAVNVIVAEFQRGAVTVTTQHVAKARKEFPARYPGTKIPILFEEGGPIQPL